LLTLVAGWWGIPWGPIYTIQGVWVNLNGGRDVTPQIMSGIEQSLVAQARKQAGA
jgi:hypothetical protein